MAVFRKPLLLSYNKQNQTYSDVIAVINWILAKKTALQAWATSKGYVISTTLSLSWNETVAGNQITQINGSLEITWTYDVFTAALLQELADWIVQNIQGTLPTGGVLKVGLPTWNP